MTLRSIKASCRRLDAIRGSFATALALMVLLAAIPGWAAQHPVPPVPPAPPLPTGTFIEVGTHLLSPGNRYDAAVQRECERSGIQPPRSGWTLIEHVDGTFEYIHPDAGAVRVGPDAEGGVGLKGKDIRPNPAAPSQAPPTMTREELDQLLDHVVDHIKGEQKREQESSSSFRPCGYALGCKSQEETLNEHAVGHARIMAEIRAEEERKRQQAAAGGQTGNLNVTGGAAFSSPAKAGLDEFLAAGGFVIDLVNQTEFGAFGGGGTTGTGTTGGPPAKVQIMIIRIIKVRAQAATAGTGRLEARADREAPLRPPSLWNMFRRMAVRLTGTNAPRAMAPLNPWNAPRRSERTPQRERGATVAAPVKMFLTSLGTSTGEAFDVRVVNDGDVPVELSGDGVVVEPMNDRAQLAGRGELQQTASRATAPQKLDAYCLEFLRQPPNPGMLFRVASQELQRKFAPMRNILRSAHELQQSGLLNPDSNPLDYFHSISQWALWTKERNFDAKSFGQAFVEYTKKNFKAAGRLWTKPAEEAITGIVPGRWNDIARVLAGAAAEQPGAAATTR